MAKHMATPDNSKGSRTHLNWAVYLFCAQRKIAGDKSVKSRIHLARQSNSVVDPLQTTMVSRDNRTTQQQAQRQQHHYVQIALQVIRMHMISENQTCTEKLGTGSLEGTVHL